MAKSKRKTTKRTPTETDSAYLLKLVLYIILGSQWLHISHGSSDVPIPIGFIIGILFTMHDHFQIDRKIEYAVLLMAVFVGFWLPMGIDVTFR